MAWQGSNRRAELPPDWNKIRGAVLKRDGYRCTVIRYDTGMRCMETVELEVDHLGSKFDHSLGNLAAKCSHHHAQHTGKQSAAGRTRRPPRRRPEGDHPSKLS